MVKQPCLWHLPPTGSTVISACLLIPPNHKLQSMSRQLRVLCACVNHSASDTSNAASCSARTAVPAIATLALQQPAAAWA